MPLIDVRTPAEFNQGHLEGAVNIEYQQIVQTLSIYGLDKTEPIELYCRSGRRSGIAMRALQQAGYQNVINLGGFEALKQQGYSVADQ